MDCKYKKVQYEICKLNGEMFKLHKNEVADLMKELFSDQGYSYCQTKMCNMEHFILDGTAIIFAAIIKEVIVGFIWGYERENAKKTRIHVTQFVVSSDYRSLGIGGVLLHCVEEWGYTHGISEVELNVSSQNDKGIRFYQNNGFVCKNLFMVKGNIGEEL